MTITINASSQPTQIRIEGEFNIYTAADSRQQLLDALTEHAAFTVELDAIEEIDTTGVQLLLWMQREAKRLNKPLNLTGASPAVQEVITLLNLIELSAQENAA
jgi:anti-anti-sigma factor